MLDCGSHVAGCFLIVSAVFVGLAERAGTSFGSLVATLREVRFQDVPSDQHLGGWPELTTDCDPRS